jgi:hypothetical protein
VGGGSTIDQQQATTLAIGLVFQSLDDGFDRLSEARFVTAYPRAACATVAVHYGP